MLCHHPCRKRTEKWVRASSKQDVDDAAQQSTRPSQQQHTLLPDTGHGEDVGSMISISGSSVVSAASGANSAVDAAADVSSVGSAAEDADLAVDWRRAKHLKNLNRMMTSPAAQSATDRFKRHTWLIVLVVFVVHIACFATFVVQITDRYQ